MTLQAGRPRVTDPSSPPALLTGDSGEASGRDAVAVGQQPVPVLRWFGVVWLTAFVVLLANQPGRMVFDTKLSVDLDPATYFAGLWHLWDPLDSFGTLHNQAIGYAVPMAPVYLAGHLAHVPVWITERLWMSLIIAAGFGGLVKLAGALGIGSRNSRLLAGLVFALWPTFTIVIGSTSAAVLPGMLAPWAVLPLVKAVHSGRPGWSGPLWPAARSGAVVALMGGVNATSTLDVLLLPALFIVTYARGRRLVSLSLAWVAAVAAATAWWTLPLLLQAKYAFNFLPYVEQSATTTGTASAAATLRGAGNWVAYLNFGTPWLPAGWALVTTPIAIAAAAAAAGCGLYGLSRRQMPAVTWLRLSVGIAAAAALAGYGGPLGGPFHGAVQQALDGTLAPFRNVYKLEPVIAAALALGVAHATARWLAAAPADSQPDRKALAIASRLVLGLMLVGLAVPYLSGRILNPGSFPAVPRYWYQVAGFLAAHSPRNAALVVPADAHGEYLWGDPIDDPLEALGTSPWVAQGLVPYGGTGSQLVLQTAENAIESGEQVPGLGAYLQRAGIRYVVVRNDLDPAQVGYTPPGVVHQTLALSGFTRVASFGAAEIYLVPGAKAGQPLSPVSALPVSQTVLVNGGPDSLLQLAGQRLLGPGQPTVVAGNPLPSSAPGWPARWAVTDGLRRADEAFGLINSNISYTYTATETNPVDDQLGGTGGPPRQFLPVPAAGHQTVAVLSGAAQVTVSSYGSWLADTQQEDPASAFDGNPATAWAEGSATTPAGQWIQITFDHPVDLPASVGIRLLDDNQSREIASRLRVSTAAGSTTASVAATGKTQPLHVAPGRTSWLRVTIAGARRVTPGGPGAGISDVLIPGVRVSRLLQPAEDPAGQRAASVSFSFHQQVPSPVTFADPAGTAPMARTFTVPQPTALRLSAAALAVPGAGLDALLDKLPPPGRGILQVSVATAGSWPGPASLFKGSQPLIAANADPVIHLSWHGKRRIRTLIVQAAGGSVPQTVEISSPAGTRQAGVGFGGLVAFKRPLTTDRIDVSFPRVQQATTVNSTGQVSTLPVELSRLFVPALAKLRVVAPKAATTFSLACGQGPALRIDGRAYPTAVSGTLGELTGFRPLRVRLCAPAQSMLALGTGRHTLTAAAPGAFAVTDLSLTGAGGAGEAGGAAPADATASATARTVTAGRWQPDQRQLTIGPGPASYLEVHENYNAGWAATLNGHQLRAVYLDGWQQGFVVPAGAGGTIMLSFRPAGSYHLALVGSLLALAVLLGLVAWSFVFRYGRAHRFAGVPSGPAPARYAALGSLGVIALTFVAGGPVALAAVVVVALAWRWPRWLPGLAFSGMAAAGLATAAAARPAAAGLFGAFGAPAQACALVALAAALAPARARQRQERPDAFGVVDELTCYFDSPAEPGNVHVEVWLPGHLDPERLREATTAMLAGQRRARARRAQGSPWRSGYTWEFPPQADLDPVSVASWQVEAELDAARVGFLAAAPPLDRSPPFRLLLARGPGRDALILNAHHAAFDGHSCLRLLHLIADQYSQVRHGQVQHGQVQYGPVAGAGAGVVEIPAEPPGPPVEGEGRVRPPVRRSVRIAPQHEKAQHEKAQHENGRGPYRAPGYGYRLLAWPGVPVVPTAGEGEPRATVNDLLVAALVETVRRWNRGRRQREHAGSCIRISVPLDARPPGGGDELGNLSRLGTVTAEPDGPGGRDLVAVVAGQTRLAKDEPGPQVDPALAAVARAWLPVAVKRRLLRAAMRCLGPLASDTSLLSNLGRVTDPPRFGPLSPERIWFSTSAHMPRGLSVGAITIEGQLQLCFRYRRALLDDATAGDFAATYAAALSSLAEPPAKEEGT